MWTHVHACVQAQTSLKRLFLTRRTFSAHCHLLLYRFLWRAYWVSAQRAEWPDNCKSQWMIDGMCRPGWLTGQLTDWLAGWQADRLVSYVILPTKRTQTGRIIRHGCCPRNETTKETMISVVGAIALAASVESSFLYTDHTVLKHPSPVKTE